ncbi:MAG: ATP-binding protein [Solobacterium sp.]|nr:ATP-binding protein [Solobacterium sp.]MCI6877213.1 ATP-binding protein [Solobacterium sp.]MDY4792473.1 ATP-binding protein [Erysipelotrichaceae bacterium]
MDEIKLIPNAPILIESTRSIGYSFETALADIIDNSLSKKADRIDVYFDSLEPFLAVIDNGTGMNRDELLDAMRYGSKSSLEERDQNDLGRFGLGMKTASLSQCRKLTVFSKKDGVLTGACWDLDYIIEKNDWSLNVYDGEECSKYDVCEYLADRDSGTIVLWEKFDRLEESTVYFQKTFDTKISNARDHIALVFHRFINDENPKNRIKIYFNNDFVEGVDPFLTTNPATQPLNEQTITFNDEAIKVKPYILPYISKLTTKDKKQLGDISDLRKTQGFYVYRNKRLIVWGTWFKLIKSHELSKLTRVRVDIPNSLDSIWNIDIKKSSAALPDSLKDRLKKIVESAVGKSANVYKYRGRKIEPDQLVHTWDIINDRGKYSYKINKNTLLYKQLIEKLDQQGEAYLTSFIEMIENSFPYEDIYYRMGKNEVKLENDEEFDKVYSVALDMIEAAKEQNLDIRDFIKNMNYIEYFAKHEDVLKRIKEEYLNGCD